MTDKEERSNYWGILEQMALLDPNEYIITRKRKKYKFALFANSPLCFEFDEWQKTDSIDVVEIGAGNAHFLVALAANHPEQQFVAIDVKGDRLQSGARQAAEQGLTNIRFIRARADQIQDLFAVRSVTTIWLTFSDPFPRARSAGRRLTHLNFLRRYAALLTTHGELCIKHDNQDFFCWTLEQLVAEHWQLRDLTFDLHGSTLSDEYKILTAYERRWLSEGRRTQFVRAAVPH